jgi:hypothetical protein
LYWLDKPNEPSKEGLPSFVCFEFPFTPLLAPLLTVETDVNKDSFFEFPFTSVSTVSRGS